MNQQLLNITLVVRDYDEAIAFYTQKLGFELTSDIRLDDEKRWVVVTPKGNGQAGLLLAEAVDDAQKDAIGNQTGGRVFLFLKTDNFWRDYEHMKSCGVHFLEEPRDEPYGIVVVFQDLYGNKWDLIQHNE